MWLPHCWLKGCVLEVRHTCCAHLVVRVPCTMHAGDFSRLCSNMVEQGMYNNRRASERFASAAATFIYLGTDCWCDGSCHVGVMPLPVQTAFPSGQVFFAIHVWKFEGPACAYAAQLARLASPPHLSAKQAAQQQVVPLLLLAIEQPVHSQFFLLASSACCAPLVGQRELLILGVSHGLPGMTRSILFSVSSSSLPFIRPFASYCALCYASRRLLSRSTSMCFAHCAAKLIASLHASCWCCSHHTVVVCLS
jgi:hypothetical protein